MSIPEQTGVSATSETLNTTTSASSRRRPTHIILAVVGSILVLLVLFGLKVLADVSKIKVQTAVLQSDARGAYDALKKQDLLLARTQVEKIESSLHVVQQSVSAYGWTRYVPFAGAYYSDSQEIFTAGFAGISAAKRTIAEIEPYADVLGFRGQGSFAGGTAQERIAKILETLGKISPALDSIAADLQKVDSALSKINEKRYPLQIGGMALRSSIVQAKSGVHEGYLFLSQNRQAVELLPEIAGASGRKKYLVLFQNSGELRPTGGFLTAYAVVNVERGKVEPEGSGDIYELDQRFSAKPPIPAILKKFLTTETRWNLRDMNLSPDFRESMTTFNQYYQTIKGQRSEFSGIIAVDTHFLESLLTVIGPVEVPGYGKFSAQTDKRCDCPQILYALSEIIDRPTPYLRENRKGILGPMMQAILQKSYSAPKNMWPQLFSTGWGDVMGKHVQMYFFDPKLQAAAEAVGAAGRVLPTPEGKDYFFLVDANLAGAKSNFFVQSEFAHVIDLPSNGVLKHSVTVSYKNPFQASNCNLEAGQLCLNGVLQDWVRIYLPPQATILSVKGFDEGSMKESEELGHKMVEGVFKLAPLSSAKLELTYSIPYANSKEYVVQLQKQGGTEDWKHTFDVNGLDHVVTLSADQKQTFPF